jgi:hypothetical protein
MHHRVVVNGEVAGLRRQGLAHAGSDDYLCIMGTDSSSPSSSASDTLGKVVGFETCRPPLDVSRLLGSLVPPKDGSAL